MERVFFVNKRQIRITKAEDARELVSAASGCDFDIDVYYNRVIVDAKSILGGMSLDFTQPQTVEYNGKNQELEQVLNRFALC